MNARLLISIIVAFGISLTTLTFVYQHIQNCEAEGGSMAGSMECDKSHYYTMTELFQKKYVMAGGLIIDGDPFSTMELMSTNSLGDSMTLLIKENQNGPYYAEILCKYTSGKTEKITKDIVNYLENGGCFGNEGS